MPNARDLTELLIAINSVDNSIWSKNDLANNVIPVFRNDATQLRKFLQTICLGNQLVPERHGTIWIVARDEEDYIVKVVSRSRRPD